MAPVPRERRRDISLQIAPSRPIKGHGMYRFLITSLNAVACCHIMRASLYTPKTIVNVGVGLPVERGVWQLYFPDAKLIGIDKREQKSYRWPEKYIRAFVSDKQGMIRTTVVDTLDNLVGDARPPCFIWMDIDGSELKALRGAAKLLEKTTFVNIELYENVDNEPREKAGVREWMTSAGYEEVYRYPGHWDVLFKHRSWGRRKPNRGWAKRYVGYDFS